MKRIIPGLLLIAWLIPAPCAGDSGNNALATFLQWRRLQAQEGQRDAKFKRIEKAAEKLIQRMRSKDTPVEPGRGKDGPGR
jgi:hypothetical protein